MQAKPYYLCCVYNHLVCLLCMYAVLVPKDKYRLIQHNKKTTFIIMIFADNTLFQKLCIYIHNYSRGSNIIHLYSSSNVSYR